MSFFTEGVILEKLLRVTATCNINGEFKNIIPGFCE
jgi:hypothetical protein